MTEKRARRLVSAGVAAAVVLLAFLLVVIAFQMVCLLQAKKELSDLQKTEKEYERLINETQDEIDVWLEEWKIEEAARKYGFRKNAD